MALNQSSSMMALDRSGSFSNPPRPWTQCLNLNLNSFPSHSQPAAAVSVPVLPQDAVPRSAPSLHSAPSAAATTPLDDWTLPPPPFLTASVAPKCPLPLPLMNPMNLSLDRDRDRNRNRNRNISPQPESEAVESEPALPPFGGAVPPFPAAAPLDAAAARRPRKRRLESLYGDVDGVESESLSKRKRRRRARSRCRCGGGSGSEGEGEGASERAAAAGQGSVGRRGRAERERAAKFDAAVFVLRAFAVEHGGKLPSLRFMMKMLKVGFPKAHEIKKQYGEREGVTVRSTLYALCSELDGTATLILSH